MAPPFLQPPHTTDAEGRERRVGFEIEFSGLEIEEAASLLQTLYGGTIERTNPYRYRIRDTEIGDFTIELDMRLLSESLMQEKLRELGIETESILSLAQEAVGLLSEAVVPFEIATPPLALSRLEIMTQIEALLRRAGAKGTGASWLYAFGLHINPEAPSLKARSILDHLRAFLLLEPWIVAKSGIDRLRKLSPFIVPFDEAYTTLVLHPDYHPALSRMIEDYLLYNPTRNRPLDLLPLFMHLHPEIVAPAIKGQKVNPRPTYHYRLPNSRIDEPEWHIADEWNRWVQIERLAADRARLSQMAASYLKIRRDDPLFFEERWIEQVHAWQG